MAAGIIKRAGLKKVQSAGFFRASNEEKGGKLCRSRHAFDVTEETTVGQYFERAVCATSQREPGSIRRHHRGLCERFFIILPAY